MTGETLAVPIPKSVATLGKAAARRAGVVVIGICRNCTDGLVRVNHGDDWVHRPNGARLCVPERQRPRQCTCWSGCDQCRETGTHRDW